MNKLSDVSTKLISSTETMYNYVIFCDIFELGDWETQAFSPALAVGPRTATDFVQCPPIFWICFKKHLILDFHSHKLMFRVMIYSHLFPFKAPFRCDVPVFSSIFSAKNPGKSPASKGLRESRKFRAPPGQASQLLGSWRFMEGVNLPTSANVLIQ